MRYIGTYSSDRSAYSSVFTGEGIIPPLLLEILYGLVLQKRNILAYGKGVENLKEKNYRH